MNKIIVLLTLVAVALLASPAHAGTGTAQLSWTAPASYTDGSAIPAGTAITYNVYTGLSASSMAKKLSGVSLKSASFTGLDNGATTYFYVTAVVAGIEGAKSAIVSKAIPALAPAPCTNLTVQ